MKHATKILLIFSVTAVLICCCCFSAAADTINGFDSAVAIDMDGFMYHLSTVPGKDSYWTRGVYFPETFYCSLFLCTDVKFTLDSSNVFTWDSFDFGLWNFGSYSSSIYEVSFVLLDSNYNILSYLYDSNYSNTNFWQGFFTIPAGKFSSSSSIDVRYIAMCITLSPNSNTTLYYYTNDYKSSFSVINSQLAEQEKTNEMLGDITSDKYTPPDGSAVGDVGDLEDSIIGDSEAGLNSVEDGFKAFSLDFFTDGLGGVVSLYNRIIPGMPWLNELLTVSLSLGIFAFLFGIAVNHSRLFDKDPVIHDKEYYEYRGDSDSRWLL